MARFTSARSLAQRLILRNGQTATLRRFEEPTLTDEDKPWRSGPTESTDYLASMVFLPSGIDYTPETRTHQAAARILIAADDLPVVPTLKDKIIRGDESWSLVEVREVNPNGERVIYSIEAVR